MKSLFKRFRKESASSADQSMHAGGVDQPSRISRGQSALKGYLKPPPKPEVVEEEDHVKTVLDILDNPDLELEPHGFDPYNSGSFDRNKSWKHVKKNTRSFIRTFAFTWITPAGNVLSADSPVLHIIPFSTAFPPWHFRDVGVWRHACPGL